MTRSRRPRNRAKAKAARIRRLTRERRHRRQVRILLNEPPPEPDSFDVVEHLRQMALEGHEEGDS